MRINLAFAQGVESLGLQIGRVLASHEKGVTIPQSTRPLYDFKRGPTPQTAGREPHLNLRNVRAFVFSMVLSPIAPAFLPAM